MRRFAMLLAALTLLAPLASAAIESSPSVLRIIEEKLRQEQIEQQKDTEAKREDATDEEKELTLERLFPEKGLFGPSAYATAFSADGRYAAYLYRPYIERRHGSDLWLYDFETGETRRITSVSVLAAFQEATRKVYVDRVKKAKKRGLGKAKDTTAGEDQADVKPGPDDGVSGDWEGTLTGGEEELGIPPEGVAFSMFIEIDADDGVSGTFRTPDNTATITDGRYDSETGSLTCSLIDPESGLTASLTATISNGEMSGTVVLEGMDVTLSFTAKRTAPLKRTVTTGDERAEETDQQETDGTRDLGDVVGDKDADDEKAPRYGGVSGFVWSPEDHDLIFVSGGDLYQYDLDTDTITRLTKTREVERAVQYLPDGGGYTYLSGNALIRVDFDSHLIEQIDPKVPAGEDMNGYELSPDGRHIAFTTTKGRNFWAQGRRVNIVTYRNRFAQVRQVMRHMPDDPMPDIHWSVYIYSLDDHMNEMGRLSKVFSVHQNRPRDRVSTPNWSPDSSRIAFAAYSQESGVVQILESELPDEETAATGGEDDNSSSGAAASETADAPLLEADQNGGDKRENDGKEKPEAVDYVEQTFEKPGKLDEANVVYRFLHNGGPQTPYMIDPEYLPDGRRMVFLTELSGFRHVHVLNPLYEQLEQLTRGRFEVYPFDLSKDHRWMFATATKEHPAQRDVYRVDLTSGELTRLSSRDGFYSSVAISNDGEQVLANLADFGFPKELVAIDVGEAEQQVLTDSHPEEAHELTEPAPQFFTYTNRHGHEIHGHMFKPDDWSADDQRPLLIYVYGGPLGTRKMATRGSFSSDSYFFAYYMAKKHGYVTCTIDPRGTSGYGGLYEKSNFEQVGKPQVEDLVDAVDWFVEHHGVDPERVGIHGWSFGGFQTQMCLYTEPDIFACGIAGAGPTEWHNYNSWYSTGTIGRNREGKTDLAEFSLLPLAKNLESKLLLVHGMEDSNVLYQDTVRIYRELLKAGKETLVELFLDPTGGHGLGGDVNRLRRMRKYEEFLTRVLGEGAPAAPAEQDGAAKDEADEKKGAADSDRNDDDAASGTVDRRQ